MRRRPTAIVAASVVAASVVVGAIWSASGGVHDDDGSRLLVGNYRPTDKITLANLTVVDGIYRVEYGAEVRFFSSAPGAILMCGLVDASGRIGYLDDTTFPVAADGVWTRIGDTATYDVPEITLGVRCSPTASGSVGIDYRNVSLTADPVR